MTGLPLRFRGPSLAFIGVLALLLVLAFATTVVAAPTKLCKANEGTCAAGNTYVLAPENFKGALGTMKLEQAGFLTVSCNAGKLASTLSEGTGPLTGEVFKWNFFNCTPEGCTLETPKTEGTGYSAEVEAISGGNGGMRIGNTPTLVLNCTTPKLTCTYTTASMELLVQGGAEATISTKISLKKDIFKSTFTCRETAIYEAKYPIVEPGTPLYVTH